MKKFSVLKKIEAKITNKSNKISSFPTEMQAPLIDAKLKVLLAGLHLLQNKAEMVLNNTVINPDSLSTPSSFMNFLQLLTVRVMVKEYNKAQVLTSSTNTNLLAFELDSSYNRTLKTTKQIYKMLTDYEKEDRLEKMDVDMIHFLKQVVEFDVLLTTKLIKFNAKFLDKQKQTDQVNAKEF